jgi:hypothetical protein
MKPDFKLTTILLVVCGVLDLVAIPFTLSANHHQSDAVPPAAIILIAIVGVVTLAAAFGVAQGMRWPSSPRWYAGSWTLSRRCWARSTTRPFSSASTA